MMLVEIAAYAFKGLLESYTPPSSLLVFVPALSMVTKPDTENSTGAAVESQPFKTAAENTGIPPFLDHRSI